MNNSNRKFKYHIAISQHIYLKRLEGRNFPKYEIRCWRKETAHTFPALQRKITNISPDVYCQDTLVRSIGCACLQLPLGYTLCLSSCQADFFSLLNLNNIFMLHMMEELQCFTTGMFLVNQTPIRFTTLNFMKTSLLSFKWLLYGKHH